MASNGTWVWNQTTPSSSYHGTITPYYSPNNYNEDDYYTSSSPQRDCDRRQGSYYVIYVTTFSNCAEMDAYVNRVWQQHPTRAAVQWTAVACQWLALLLHFALWVWACVDTARRNKRKSTTEAEILAGQIVMRMVANGQIVRPQGGYVTVGEGLPPMQQPMQQTGWPLAGGNLAEASGKGRAIYR